MSAAAQSPSKYVLAELTLRSMIELERAKAGLDYEGGVLSDLSAALLQSYDTSGGAASFTFIEPSLYEPYERLVSHCDAGGQSKSVQIQSHIQSFSDTLSKVVNGDEGRVEELIPICTSLHRELVQEINAEIAFGVNDWPSVHEESAAGVSAS